MMNLIAFDTSTHMCSVDLHVNGKEYLREEVAPMRHTELILPMIQDLLKQAGCQLSDCDAIAFGQGPGSFMGVRFAASIAQGLSFTHNIPCIKVSTLHALAQILALSHPGQLICSAWDARMSEMYFGCYRQSGDDNIVSVISADQLIQPQDVKLSAPCVCVGNAWGVYASDLPDLASIDVIDMYPSAKEICAIAQARGIGAAGYDFSPVYFRAAVVPPR